MANTNAETMSKRGLFVRLQELANKGKNGTQSTEPQQEQLAAPTSSICISPAASLHLLGEVESLNTELDILYSGVPLIHSLRSKLESFQKQHEALLQAYFQKHSQVDEMRDTCRRQNAEVARAVTSYRSVLTILHQKTEENALLRLKNFEQWEEICQLIEQLEQGESNDESWI